MRTFFSPIVMRAALVAALFAPTAFAAQLTVGPTGTYPDVAAALAVANAGDVILVQPGTYHGPLQITKAVRIIGPGPDHAVLTANHSFGIRVAGVPHGAEVVISGFEVRTTGPTVWTSSIHVQSCPGTVVLHDVVVKPATEHVALFVEGGARVVLSECAMLDAGNAIFEFGQTFGYPTAVRVVTGVLWVINSRITGGPKPMNAALPGNAGIAIYQGTLHVWNSHVAGGNAVFGTGSWAHPGGPGIFASQSSVVLYGGPDAVIRGGNGSVPWTGGLPANGGPGVYLSASSSLVYENDVPMIGGMDGLGIEQMVPVFLSGANPGTATEVDESFPVLTSGAPAVSIGTSLPLAVRGEPGAGAAVFAAVGTGPVYPTEVTLLFLPVDALFVGAAVLDPDGVAGFDLGVPPFPGLVGIVVHLQAAQFDLVRLTLSNPTFAPIVP